MPELKIKKQTGSDIKKLQFNYQYMRDIDKLMRDTFEFNKTDEMMIEIRDTSSGVAFRVARDNSVRLSYLCMPLRL